MTTKSADIRNMDKPAIAKEIAIKKMDEIKAKMAIMAGNSKETHKLKSIRRDIARLQTIHNEIK